MCQELCFQIVPSYIVWIQSSIVKKATSVVYIWQENQIRPSNLIVI